MAEEQPAKTAAMTSSEAGITQIRVVTKWLIGAFAAIGVALAAGSQLSEIGTLSHWRLVAAFGGVVAVLVGICIAVLFATKVLAPAPITLSRLVTEGDSSPIGKEIKKHPDLLPDQGATIVEFNEQRDQAIADEDEAWEAYEEAPNDQRARLKPAIKTAEGKRKRFDGTLGWLLVYARFLEVNAKFRTALAWMVLGGFCAALGIAGFAWAAHPEEESESSSSAAPASPAEIHVDLSPAGEKSFGDALGAECEDSGFDALALGGPANAIEAVTIPAGGCELARFVLTPVLGTFKATKEVELTAKSR